jgi:hypothetical protein
MHLHLTPDCELSGLNHGMQELQQTPVGQLIHHFMSAKAAVNDINHNYLIQSFCKIECCICFIGPDITKL